MPLHFRSPLPCLQSKTNQKNTLHSGKGDHMCNPLSCSDFSFGCNPSTENKLFAEGRGPIQTCIARSVPARPLARPPVSHTCCFLTQTQYLLAEFTSIFCLAFRSPSWSCLGKAENEKIYLLWGLRINPPCSCLAFHLQCLGGWCHETQGENRFSMSGNGLAAPSKSSRPS